MRCVTGFLNKSLWHCFYPSFLFNTHYTYPMSSTSSTEYLKTLVKRLTPISHRAFNDAANRTLSRTHHEIEIEHVLLALLDQTDNAMSAALRALGTDIDRLQRDIEQAVDGFRSGSTRNPLFSVSLAKWLERAWMIASAGRGEENLSSLDLLLALLADDTLRSTITSSAPILLRLDTTKLDEAYVQLRQHGGEGSTAGTSAGAARTADDITLDIPPPSIAGKRATPGLDKYTIDLTAQARAGKIDPVLGREAEIRQMTDILLRRRQNNPILTGEPGVGKTAVVEGLAAKIVAEEVPPALIGTHLRTLDLGLLQAGASVKGEFENRLRQVIDEVKGSTVPIILFIDEAHLMIGAGAAAGAGDAANLLKPALARGELRTIAATTWKEYKKYFEKDAALARRFQVVKIEEPTPEAAEQMARGVALKLAEYHKVDILDAAVRAAVQLSSRYISGRQLPDKAISVLDTACARIALSKAGRPGPVEDVEVLISNIDRELDALAREEGHEERIALLKAKRVDLETDLAQLRTAWEAQTKLVDEIDAIKAEVAKSKENAAKVPAKVKKTTSPLQVKREELRVLQKTLAMAFECVDENVIADVISGWTGIPLGRMVSDELQQVRDLAKLLAERVIGQDHAMEQIAERIQIAKANLEDPGKPKGVFLLTGPSGVGKTETAFALAEALYGGERNLITINMSEYQEAHTVSGLKGSPPGYVGYGEGGVLTEAVRRKPYSVVLLDEVEKAHPDVLELFFQVFDKGKIEDAEGQEIDFKNTVIILTANVGADLVMHAVEYGVSVPQEESETEESKAEGETQGEGKPVETRDPTPEDLVEILRPTLQKTFKPAFLGRLTVVPFFPISDSVLREIITLKLSRVKKRITTNYNCIVDFPEKLVEFLACRCNDIDSGARDAETLITRTVLAQTSRALLARAPGSKPVKKIAVIVGQDDLKVKIS